jgi:Fe-S cluster biosynthesis and repair protein YggX
MTHQVFCLKLKQEAEGLPRPPYPGPLGQKIYDHISLAAWKMWQSHQTMLINEYRLNLMDPTARTFLEAEMEKFLFSEDSEKPPGYREEE